LPIRPLTAPIGRSVRLAISSALCSWQAIISFLLVSGRHGGLPLHCFMAQLRLWVSSHFYLWPKNGRF